MEQKIIDLYKSYCRDELTRRDFLAKLAILAGGVAAAYSLLPLLEDGEALAALVPADDPRIDTEMVTYSSTHAEMTGYQACMKGAGKFPGVVVIHENRGLNQHIEDVARRVALEGFLALAPDALSASGGTPKDAEKAKEMIGALDYRQTIDNFVAAVSYLKTHPRSTGKVGVVGFCWGGAMTNQVAVHSGDVSAAVPYYGKQPEAGDVGRIKASLLLHYAGLDERINNGIAAFATALSANGVEYSLHMYEGAKHAFNNDTNPDRYQKEAAELAWKRTIAFFRKKLQG